MLFRRALLVLVVCVPVAGAGELRTLKGDALKGDLVKISDKEVVFEKAGEKITIPLPQVLSIDLVAPTRIPLGNKYSEVELVDGSLFAAKTSPSRANRRSST